MNTTPRPPRPARHLAAAALLLGGCAAGQRPGAPSAPPTVTLEAGRFDEISRDDRVGPGDSPHPDGQPDVRFTARITGRVSGLILTVCNGEDSPTSTQWDTIVGQDAIPSGFLHRLGQETWVLGVFDPQGRLLNRDDGSLPELSFGAPTALGLFVSQRDTLLPGSTVCLTVLRPDGPVQRSVAEIRMPPEA